MLSVATQECVHKHKSRRVPRPDSQQCDSKQPLESPRLTFGHPYPVTAPPIYYHPPSGHPCKASPRSRSSSFQGANSDIPATMTTATAVHPPPHHHQPHNRSPHPHNNHQVQQQRHEHGCSGAPAPSSGAISQALEIARESPDGAMDPLVSKILEWALADVWAKVQAQPDSYVMTRDEFAVFNFFQYRFKDDKEATSARRRFWDNFRG